MILLFFLSSGLFLGWSLGANDAANIFGTAVGSRMVRFRTAAIVASIFVIIGAVIQGAGASETLGKLGNVSTLAAAFTVALASALTVFWMTRSGLPVSTSQAIVGSIIGWNFYTSNPTDLNTLTKIVTTWISGPILGGVFAIVLFMILQQITKKSFLHLIYRDALVRASLLIIGAFGAYSLGANNIANVMGVFTDAIHFPELSWAGITISSKQQLFFIGGVAIAVGIITYSKHVMTTVGNTLMPLTPEAALIVVLSQALVLFIFSSSSLSNAMVSIGLPPIPLVPVSSSQVVIGSIIGIGLYKGGKEIKLNILGSISLGWIATPVAAGVLSFFLLFFVNNVFKQEVNSILLNTENQPSPTTIVTDTLVKKSAEPDTTVIFNEIQVAPAEDQGSVHTNKVLITGITIAGTIFIILISMLILQKRKHRNRITNLEKTHEQQIHLLEDNIAREKKEFDSLDKELRFRQSEMMTMAMNIIHKNEFLNDLKNEIVQIKTKMRDYEGRQELNKLNLLISQNISIDRDREKFQLHVDEHNSRFLQLLSENFPSMTDNEKRLAALLRINLSSKEIASILNISPKSVEMNRYRLRKKLKVPGHIGLSDFIREL